MSRYSVTEAQTQLPRLLEEAEAGGEVEITKSGRLVAVLVGKDEYRNLRPQSRGFWERYQSYRSKTATPIDPDEVFGHTRSREPGRDSGW